jgi:hypothetical protein
LREEIGRWSACPQPRYRRAKAGGAGRIRAGGIERDVTFGGTEPGRYGPAIVCSVVEMLRQRNITPHIARRGTTHGSGLGIHRWYVERTIAWLHAFKRLRVRYERQAEIHQALLSADTHGTTVRTPDGRGTGKPAPHAAWSTGGDRCSKRVPRGG